MNSTITQGIRKDEDKFDYNKDADRFVCPAGHLSIRKARQGKRDRGINQVDTYYFDVQKCRVCPLRDYYKEKSKHRYKIEAKNGELKNVHGYGRASSYGIENMRMQGAMTIFTVNLKRILKLTV